MSDQACNKGCAMAEDDDRTEAPAVEGDETAGPAPATGTSERTGTAVPGDEEDAGVGEGPEPPARATARTASVELTAEQFEQLPVDVRNKFTWGTLTVHYASRDVDYPMDGDTAMRLLAMLAGTGRDLDRVDPSTSDARHGWVMIDRTDVVGAQWNDTTSFVPRRVTVDPTGALVDRT